MSDTDLFVIGKLVDLAVQVFAALIALKMWELYRKTARSLRLSPNKFYPQSNNELKQNLPSETTSEHLGKLVIDIVKAIVKFDIDSFVVEEAPRVKARLEHAEEMKKFQEKRSKKK